ncbi:hypothetical protein DVR12_06470 [Chitinophaga silvatica]|uniref:Uncharacterized protein n=1 Tax=Chitinophaga silvatica TaxID=2282649 RepID=A0A3E1YEE1_9BACT|nr:hypothetical protein [Chitinophaga silvatica]RFS24833.1 hypothetical protein DVR12_06470 [Chitinophaga silvatica]
MNKKANQKGVTALLIAASCILVLLISGMPSVKKATKQNCTSITGIVAEIKSGSPGLIIHLQDNPHIFYISSKTNIHLTSTELEKAIKGKYIQLYTIQHWSPLDPFSSMQEIHRLQLGDNDIIFSEF